MPRTKLAKIPLKNKIGWLILFHSVINKNICICIYTDCIYVYVYICTHIFLFVTMISLWWSRERIVVSINVLSQLFIHMENNILDRSHKWLIPNYKGLFNLTEWEWIAWLFWFPGENKITGSHYKRSFIRKSQTSILYLYKKRQNVPQINSGRKELRLWFEFFLSTESPI